MSQCDRCRKEARVISVSWFNIEKICPECSKKEREHPKYEIAKAIEHKECMKGNFNFEGIGLPKELIINH